MKLSATLPLVPVLAALAIAVTVTDADAQETGSDNPPSVLTIDQAVRIGLERSLDLRLSEINRDNAGAGIRSAFGSFLPRISAGGGYSHSSGTRFVEETSFRVDNSTDSYSASAGASLEIFDGFRRTASYNAAQATYDAAEESLEQARNRVSWTVRQAYLNALAAKQIVDVREAELGTSREQLELVRGRVEGGIAIADALYIQESEVANAEFALEQSRTDYLVAKDALSSILNYDPVEDFDLSAAGLASLIDSAVAVENRKSLGTLEELLERQAENRPDIQSARLRVEAAESRITVARSSYWPSLNASFGYNWGQSEGVESSGTSFNLQASILIFDGFQRSEQVQVAQSATTQAEIELRRLELEARASLSQALARLEGSERSLIAAQKAVAAARRSRRAADERFNEGLGSYTDYLLAGTRLIDAQIRQVQAVYDYRRALYEIDYLVGSR